MRTRQLAVLVVAALAAPPAFGEIIHLKDGRTLNGPLLEDPQDPAKFILIKRNEKMAWRVSRADVASIESDDAPEIKTKVKALVDSTSFKLDEAPKLFETLDGFANQAAVRDALVEKLKIGGTEARKLCVKALAAPARGTGDTVKALVHAAVSDSIASVRSQAMTSLREINSAEAGPLFTQSLASSDAYERIRSAKAMMFFPNQAAVNQLILLNNPNNSGSSNGTPRAHIFVGTEAAYISNWQVAAGGTGFRVAEVAVPVIDILQTGVVLDVGVQYVIDYECAVRGDALRFLTGESYGSVQEWRDWWGKAKPHFALAAAAAERLAALKPADSSQSACATK